VTRGRATGQAFICVRADGENSIVVLPGANADLTESDVDAGLPALAPGGGVVLLQCELAPAVVGYAAGAAARRGYRVVLNASPVRDLPPELLRLADPLVVNLAEAGQLAGVPDAPGVAAPGEVARRLLALGVRSAVITMGGAGAFVSTVDESASVPAAAVEVVDTTGAGDAFAGTLAAHLAAGVGLVAAVRPAVEAASRATTHAGAQDWSFPHSTS
jgi:ribokinase